MDIRVVSSLTTEDEDRIARLLIAVITRALDDLPIAYALSVKGGRQMFRHSRLTVPELPTAH